MAMLDHLRLQANELSRSQLCQILPTAPTDHSSTMTGTQWARVSRAPEIRSSVTKKIMHTIHAIVALLKLTTSTSLLKNRRNQVWQA